MSLKLPSDESIARARLCLQEFYRCHWARMHDDKKQNWVPSLESQAALQVATLYPVGKLLDMYRDGQLPSTLFWVITLGSRLMCWVDEVQISIGGYLAPAGYRMLATNVFHCYQKCLGAVYVEDHHGTHESMDVANENLREFADHMHTQGDLVAVKDTMLMIRRADDALAKLCVRYEVPPPMMREPVRRIITRLQRRWWQNKSMYRRPRHQTTHLPPSVPGAPSSWD